MKLPLQTFLTMSFLCKVIAQKGQSKKSGSTKSETQEAAGEKRFQDIVKLDMPVISLSDANFTKFISDRPRPYSVAIMFTALSDKYQCTICEIMAGTWKEAANFYKIQYDLKYVSKENRLVFFLVDVENARSTFGKIGIESVPRTIVLPPTEVGGAKQKIGDFELRQESLTSGPAGLLAEIGTMIGIKIKITLDPWPALFLLGAFSIALAWIVTLASQDISAALLWYRSPRIWIVVSMICFGVGVSGSIYCIIRSAPLYGSGRKGVSIFSGQNREQYVLEGIILALFTLCAGMSMVGMHYSTKIKYSLLRHLGVMICLSALIVMLLQIWNAYTDKTRWYSLKDTVPPPLWQWVTASVKKNSGLAKRLWRLSEYWLLEYKDFDGLKKKAKVLVFDYIGRQYFGWKGLSS